MTDRHRTTKQIVRKLSGLIYQDLLRLADEQTHPGMGADESDATISDCKARIKVLRSMRNEIEELVTGGQVGEVTR